MPWNAVTDVPAPRNEPVLSHAPGTPERAALKSKLSELSGTKLEIPLVIGGKEVRTGTLAASRVPHRHAQILAEVHQAGAAEALQAVAAALAAKDAWAALPFDARAAVFLRAADLLAGPWRSALNASTMLGQSKTAFQAEIDAACELIDFFRWNVHFARRLLAEQPVSAAGMWNRMDYRPLDGFVFAVTPFNFTSIAGNLPTAPALMGNTVVWKPAGSSLYSGWFVMQLLRAAGLPDGVVNFLPGPSGTVGEPILTHPDLGGVHFTGSTAVFQKMWATVGTHIAGYRQYPRLVGETGGKDFILAHPSADADAVAVAIVRGSFEYQGQKCSAASRAYVPESLWKTVSERVVAETNAIRMGDVADFRNFMGAVIDKASFDNIRSYVESAKKGPGTRLLAGGECDDREGFFVRPTVVEATDPSHKVMCEEIFGPVIAIHVYPDSKWKETLRLVDSSTPYALTGAVLARDRAAIEEAASALRYAAGNFYVNDKPTGAVVGQQPFGGSRASGTNDKAGSFLNLVRWTSPRTLKETFDPPRTVPYPFMDAE